MVFAISQSIRHMRPCAERCIKSVHLVVCGCLRFGATQRARKVVALQRAD